MLRIRKAPKSLIFRLAILSRGDEAERKRKASHFSLLDISRVCISLRESWIAISLILVFVNSTFLISTAKIKLEIHDSWFFAQPLLKHQISILKHNAARDSHFSLTHSQSLESNVRKHNRQLLVLLIPRPQPSDSIKRTFFPLRKIVLLSKREIFFSYIII